MIQNTEINHFSMQPGEIHLWLVNIDHPFQYETEFEILLSKEELAQAGKYRFEKDRQDFIARRGILRLLLGKYCKASPKSITFQVTPFGKLSFPSCPHSFNISHSKEKTIFGFSDFPEIGVDIEQIQYKPDLVHIAERWFSPEELSELSALPSQLQTEAFYHVWTQKEAYIKSRGLGLSLPLKDFTVSVDPRKPARLASIVSDSDDSQEWKLLNVPCEPVWRAAVCVRAEIEPDILYCLASINELFHKIL